jgi:hypothetical protein
VRALQVFRCAAFALALFFGGASLAPTAAAQGCPDQCVCKASYTPYLFHNDCISQAWYIVHQMYNGCCELDHSVVCDTPEPCYFLVSLYVLGDDFKDCNLEVWIDGVVVYSDPHSVSGTASFLVNCGTYRWIAITSWGQGVVGLVMQCFDCAGEGGAAH